MTESQALSYGIVALEQRVARAIENTDPEVAHYVQQGIAMDEQALEALNLLQRRVAWVPGDKPLDKELADYDIPALLTENERLKKMINHLHDRVASLTEEADEVAEKNAVEYNTLVQRVRELSQYLPKAYKTK